jgi:short-subunit dehydrogenase
MACRDMTRANTAMEEIKEESKDCVNVGELLVKQLDLNSLESVRECAKDILSSEQNIHLLVNNAGLLSNLYMINLF